MCELAEDTISDLRDRWDHIYYTKTANEPQWLLPEDRGTKILLKDIIIATLSNWPEYEKNITVAEVNKEFQNWLSDYDLCNYRNEEGFIKRVPENRPIVIDYTDVHGAWVDHCREKYPSFNIDLRGLDLSNQKFDGLQKNISRQIFLFGANLDYSKLEKCSLAISKFWFCSIRNADLNSTSFKGSSFHGADLTYSNLEFCHFENANICGTKLYYTRLKNIRFNEVTRVDSATRFINGSSHRLIFAEKEKRFKDAADTYGHINNLYAKNGFSFNANIFLYRELVCRRKINKRLKRYGKLFFVEWPFKYALSPARCLMTILFIVMMFSGFFLLNFDYLDFNGKPAPESFLDKVCASFHFSVASFSTVGFGDISPDIGSLAQFASNSESIIGVVIMGVFIASILRVIK